MKVIVNVQYRNGEQIFATDLEVPSIANIGNLSRWMAHALNIDDVDSEFEYQYLLFKQGDSYVALSKTESLSSLGLWDGTRLILKRQRTGRKKRVEKIIASNRNKTEAFLESDTQKYILNGEKMWIGRSTPRTPPEVLETLIDLKGELQFKTVSRKHTQIIMKDNEYFLKTPRKNIPRTFINEKNPKSDAPQPLADGDKIKLGAVVLQFKLHNTEAQ